VRETRSTDGAGPAAPRHYVGLDLGQAHDYTAAAVLQVADVWSTEARGWTDKLTIGYLRRWELGTSYPAIVRDVAALVRRPPLRTPTLVVDSTGCGRPVADLLCEADVEARVRPVVITSGFDTTREGATLRVPKRTLVGTLQVLLQARRLTIAQVPFREALARELLAFRVRITAAGNESFEAWRERDHDDLVLAVALACWAAGAEAAAGAALPFALGGPVRAARDPGGGPGQVYDPSSPRGRA
jgi:hypothetical protein